MKKAVQKAVRPTVADLVSRMSVAPVRFTAEQRAEVAKAFAHNDAESNPKKRLGAIPLHRLLVDFYEYRGSRTKMERDAIAEFKRDGWARK